MKRRLMLLNLALIILAAVAGWQLYQQWTAARAKVQSVAEQRLEPVPPPAAAPFRPVSPLAAAAYEAVAQQMLFAPDRNPTVVLELAATKPMPSLPVLHGVMNVGNGLMAIFSEKADGPHHAYSPGETIGEFKLISLDSQEVALEWDGQTLRKKLGELRRRGAERPAPTTSETTPRPAATPVAKAPPRTEPQQSEDLSAAGLQQTMPCEPGDTSPAGTVRNGMRKVVRESPFGTYCRWEPMR